MILRKVLIVMILPSVMPYYFYNPLTKKILSRSSLNGIPAGHKLLPAPKSNIRNGRRNRGGVSGTCTDAGFTCSSPYERSLTFQFECDYDSQCPTYYKCCPQRCFLHKICSRASVEVLPNGNDTYDRPGICEKWPYNCQAPYHHSLTSMFRCYSDRQCPRGFKCCQQSCFSHRICSRTSGINVNRPTKQQIQPPKRIPITKTPETVITYVDAKTVSSTESTLTTAGYEIDTTEVENVSDTESSTTTDQETTEVVSSTETPVTETETHVSLDTLRGGEKDKENEDNLLKSPTRTVNPLSINRTNITPDSNAIIPEYSAYYYHYGEANITDEYDDYEEEDEDEEYE